MRPQLLGIADKQTNECWCTVVSTGASIQLPMKTGDLLLEIDGEEITKKSYENVVECLRGAEQARLKLSRPST
jgi:C-terminal processing protease CtpA/Prc